MATDLGKVGMVTKGTWSNSTTYEVLDTVTYNGTLYVAKQAVPAGTLPTNTTYWQNAVDVQGSMFCYSVNVVITTANTNENFYFALPAGVDNTYSVFASFGLPVSNAGYSARLFSVITNNQLRIGVYASYVQSYNINILFVKNKGGLSPITP